MSVLTCPEAIAAHSAVVGKDANQDTMVLKQFIRETGPKQPNRLGQPVGVLVAMRLPDKKYVLGVSICKTKVDKFDKAIGEQIAVGRALKHLDSPMGYSETIDKLPFKYASQWFEFVDRATSYFQGHTLI